MPSATTISRTIGRVALGGVLLSAGIGHLTNQRQEFQAQVPDWVPLSKDAVVLASGGVEIVLGTALITVVRRKTRIGRLAGLDRLTAPDPLPG